MSNLTPKSKTVPELDIVLSQLTPFDTEFNIFSLKSNQTMEKRKGTC